MSEKLLVQIKDNGVGFGEVRVGGVDISKHVQGVDVKIRAGQATEVVLHIPAHQVELETEIEWHDLIPAKDGQR